MSDSSETGEEISGQNRIIKGRNRKKPAAKKKKSNPKRTPEKRQNKNKHQKEVNKLKIAIVTGASSGLGKEFVKQIEHLYKELDEIWVIARRRERLEELKSCMFTNVRILEGNLCEQNIYQELKVLLKEKDPDIRMLVMQQDLVKLGK